MIVYNYLSTIMLRINLCFAYKFPFSYNSKPLFPDDGNIIIYYIVEVVNIYFNVKGFWGDRKSVV